MDALLRLQEVCRRLVHHDQTCPGSIQMTGNVPSSDQGTVVVHCDVCAEHFETTITVDDALALKAAGMVTNDDFRRLYEQAQRRSVN